MKIKSLAIKNVKGMACRKFDLDLIPNKPNLLVAPNGFGKSSLAVAFDSMNSRRMKLSKEDCYQGDEALAPELSVEIERNDGTVGVLRADNQTNTISSQFDVYVVRCPLVPKATKRKIGEFTQATPSLEVKTIDLRSIPDYVGFEYRYSQQKLDFGPNGKVLPNISDLLLRSDVAAKVHDHDIASFKGKRVCADIVSCIANINAQSGTAEQIKQWIAAKLLPQLQGIVALHDLAKILGSIDKSGLQDETEAFLAAMQFVRLYEAEPEKFLRAGDYVQYCGERDRYKQLLKDLYGGWAKVKLDEDKDKHRLCIRFPKANHLSSGERDFTTLVFALEKARLELEKDMCILIIDEIFDYFDDANLVAFQYYVTDFIETFKDQGRELFPILLTHLDPALFNHFCFGGHKLKIHYLDVVPSGKSADTTKLIAARASGGAAMPAIEEQYFHYHPVPVLHQGQFAALNLRQEWEDPAVFRQYIEDELSRYLGGDNFDPLAICFAVRMLVEEAIYKKIVDPAHRIEYLAKHGTTKKLEYAVSVGIEVPELYFMLGLIYNDGLHWRNGRDIVSPVSTKLRHPVIKHLVSRVADR